MKGIMAEAELHVLRARLEGGIKNKAARGELRRGLPVGLIWGEADGEIRFHPDEAVTGVIAAVFEPVRGVRVGARHLAVAARPGPALAAAAGRLYLHGSPDPEITWVEPTYHAVHTTLTHPAYAGAYVYGRTRKERYLGPDGALRTAAPQAAPRPVGGPHPRSPPRVHRLGHLPGQPGPHRRQHPPAGQPAGHRRGPRRLRAAAGPGHLRHLRPQARHLLPRPGQDACRTTTARAPPSWSTGRGARHMSVGGQAIDAAVAAAFLAALAAGRAAGLPASRRAARSTATTPRWTSTAARSSRPATTPPGPSAATGPSTRTTGWSPAAWKPNGTPPCSELADAEAELARRQTARPRALTPAERAAILALGDDLGQVWDAPTTTDKDRKQLLRTLLEEVNITAAPRRPGPARPT